MTSRPSILAGKLAKIAGEVKYVQMDGRNSEQKYNYATAAAVLSKINDALVSNGIAVSSRADLAAYNLENREGRAARTHAVVKLSLTFVDAESGEVLTVEGLGAGCDSGDKAVMKANTAALKYAYANAFTISWGDDPEADEKTDSETRSVAAPKAAEVDIKKVIASLNRALGKAASTEAFSSIRTKILENREALKTAGAYDDLVEKFKTKSTVSAQETVNA